MPGGKKVYSKRYPPAPETMEIIHTQQSAEERVTTKKSFDEFLRRIETESTYVLIPERIDRGKHFVALAIELSQKYEIDIDIWQKSYFIEVNLHLFCSSYPYIVKDIIYQSKKQTVSIVKETVFSLYIHPNNAKF